jgi:hypothetical protein
LQLDSKISAPRQAASEVLGPAHKPGAVAPPIVHEVLRSPGRPLDPPVRHEMESVLGHDFSRVRVHTDARAARSAQAVDALAYTVGSNVVFAEGGYSPFNGRGKSLLAHELTHVVQQRHAPAAPARLEIDSHSGPAEREAKAVSRGEGSSASPGAGASVAGVRLQRFTAGERDQITDLDTVIATAQRIADERGIWGMMRWGRFAAGVGARGAWESLGSTSSIGARLPGTRYLFTCRCGLIDLVHFYQLMYISLIKGNRSATEMGREHELTAEATSRFAPEDTPSNAMGALFGAEQSWVERQSTFVSELRRFLSLCRPVNFRSLSPADQDTIVNYYSARGTGGIPLHQTESALPAHLEIAACASQAGMFPFVLAGPDIERKTLAGEVSH